MLGQAELMAFVATREPKRARAFYEGVLGLTFVAEDMFAVVMEGNGVKLRMMNVSTVESFQPHPFTVLGWRVADIQATVRGLMERGVTFERYHGMQLDDLGIWLSPGGARVAWFKDPDGNILSVTQMGSGE